MSILKSSVEAKEKYPAIYKSTIFSGNTIDDEKNEVISTLKNFKIQSSDSYRVRLYQSAPIKDLISAMDVAGRNVVTNDICGTYARAYICDCHSSIKIKKMSCNNLYCPLCFKTASYRRAGSASDRLISAREFYKEQNVEKHLLNINHVIVSYKFKDYSAMIMNGKKEKWYDLTTYKGYQKFKKRTIDILRVSGVKGGILIYHPYRLSKTYPKEMIFGPHFHLMIFGHLVPSPIFYSRYSVVYKNKGARNTHESVTKTVGYQLTHCGRFKKHHAYNWFGDLSYNRLQKIKLPKQEGKKQEYEKTVYVRDVLCDACGSPHYKILNKVNISGDVNPLSKKKSDEWISGSFVLKGKNVVINNNCKIEIIGKLVTDRTSKLTEVETIYKFKYKKYVYKPRDKVPKAINDYMEGMFNV